LFFTANWNPVEIPVDIILCDSLCFRNHDLLIFRSVYRFPANGLGNLKPAFAQRSPATRAGDLRPGFLRSKDKSTMNLFAIDSPDELREDKLGSN
jgi:hypothetical protein